jgi:hypothetical protein
VNKWKGRRAESPTALYTDGPHGGKAQDAVKRIGRAMDSYDRLRAHALSPVDSRAYVERLLKEYRS